jgi:protease-4
MSDETPSTVGSTPAPARWRRILSGVGRALDALQTGLKRLFVLLAIGGAVAGVVAGIQLSRPPALQDKTVLVLDLKGPLREQAAGGARDSVLAQVQGQETQQVRLRDVLAVLDHAQRDPKIRAVMLKLDNLGGAGLSSLREVASAIERFKASGKPVVAWGYRWDQRAYYLAAQANEVWLHPMGGVWVEGYGRQRNYYKDALDKLGVQANVIRVGKYKNAGEPYFTNGPSKETLDSEAHVYEAIWAMYRRGVEKARKLPDGSIQLAIDSLPASMVAQGGNAANWALQQKWVDALKTHDEMRQAMIDAGAADEEKKTFRQVSLSQYLRQLPARPVDAPVAIVVAEGEIGDGQAPAGRVGGDSTSALIRKAREDDKVKAVVLRVNSPGGSAFASEQIRRELELSRVAGKPVVVSMGDVAASGGYWIAMAADEVIAEPSTITGSIGVFGILPTAQGLMDKAGVRTGGYRTTWLVGAYDFRRDLDPRFAQLVQASIGHIYTDFTAKAAAARSTTREAIDAVAQGRIWTGEQARGHGLIDRTGTLADALKAARERAKLPEDAAVSYVEKSPGPLTQLLQRLGVGPATSQALLVLAQTWGWASEADTAMGPAWAAGAAAAAPWLPATGVAADLVWLSDVVQARQPLAAVVHCLCGSER